MENIKDRFIFDLPGEWEDQTVYHFRGPRLGDTEHMVRLTLDRNLQHDEIKSFATEKSNPIKNQAQNIEVLKDKEVTIEGGYPVWEFIYKWVMADDLVTYHKYVFVIAGKLGFTFSCDFTKKTFKILGLQIQDLVDSVVPGSYTPIEEE